MWKVQWIINTALICGALHVILASPSQGPPDHLVPPPQTDYASSSDAQPSLMGRIASWFGFGDNPTGVDLTASDTAPSQSQIQQRYYEPPPPAVLQKQKSNCNICNKIPWIPMVGDQHLPVLKRESLPPSNHNHPVQYQSPSVQKFQFQKPPPIKSYPAPHTHHQSYITYPQQQPQLQKQVQNAGNQQILIPSYSAGNIYANRYPPALQMFEYYPQPQNPSQFDPSHNLIPIPVPNLSVTPLPPIYGPKPFFILSQPGIGNSFVKSNSVSASAQRDQHSAASQVTSGGTSNSDFDIVKSISLGEFTSSIEYPPSIVQSPVIDLTENRQSNKDIQSQNEYITEPIVVADTNFKEPDSYPSASAPNVTVFRDNTLISDFAESFKGPVTETTLDVEDSEDIYTTRGVSNTLPAKIDDNLTNIKRDRETPKELLDSPIYYLKKTSVNPPTDPVISYSSWHPTKITEVSHLSTPFTTRSTEPASAATFPQSTFGISSTEVPFHPSTDNKKSKQIQIIIPYTSNKQPRPFKKSYENGQGWLDINNDFHDSQESKYVTTSVTHPPKRLSTKYLTKVKASNLRELLHKERNADSNPVDIEKLQKSIDGWTEQEFSMVPIKASTISLARQTKNIPTEYLTTPGFGQSSASAAAIATTEDIRQTTTVEPYYADEGYKKVGDVIESNSLGHDNTKIPNKTSHSFKASSFSNSAAFWDSLKLSISPHTKERVYVVTPQPLKEFTVPRTELAGDFKSPRFSIRPTPGIGSTTLLGDHFKATLAEKGKLQAKRNKSKMQQIVNADKTKGKGKGMPGL